MCFEAGFGTAAVRYASVGAGFRGPSGPPTVGEPAGAFRSTRFGVVPVGSGYGFEVLSQEYLR